MDHGPLAGGAVLSVLRCLASTSSPSTTGQVWRRVSYSDTAVRAAARTAVQAGLVRQTRAGSVQAWAITGAGRQFVADHSPAA